MLAGIALLGATGVSRAAGPDAAYAVKGADSVNCGQFADLYEQKAPELANFGGWIDGYLTAKNESSADVFDISPWQSVDFLVHSIASYCRTYPQLKFHQAATVMVAALRAGALTEPSEVVAVRNGDKAILLYRDIVVRLQLALGERGFRSEDAPGEFGPSTIDALSRFQREEEGLSVTGLPDQATLVRLLGGESSDQ